MFATANAVVHLSSHLPAAQGSTVLGSVHGTVSGICMFSACCGHAHPQCALPSPRARAIREPSDCGVPLQLYIRDPLLASPDVLGRRAALGTPHTPDAGWCDLAGLTTLSRKA